MTAVACGGGCGGWSRRGGGARARALVWWRRGRALTPEAAPGERLIVVRSADHEYKKKKK